MGVELPGWAEGAPVVPLCRMLAGLALPELWPAISAKRAAQLEAAARRIDHYAGRPGAWVEVVCWLLEGWAGGEPGPFCTEPARSLGALAIELRREANSIRHGALERAGGRLRVFASHRGRQKVKRWRMEVRQAERAYPGTGRNLRRPRDR